MCHMREVTKESYKLKGIQMNSIVRDHTTILDDRPPQCIDPTLEPRKLLGVSNHSIAQPSLGFLLPESMLDAATRAKREEESVMVVCFFGKKSD